MGAPATAIRPGVFALQALRSTVAGWPRVYLPLVRAPLVPGWRHRRSLALHRRTEVVIEGYPRSGNSFAVVAFEMAQGRPVVVAHHLHVPAQVIAGVRRGLPTLVVVRDPAEAIVSRIIRRPRLRPDVAYRQYVAYHRRLLPWADGFVVAEFQEVTGDFGSATARLNRRFGTAYEAFEHSTENVARCFALLDQIAENERERAVAPGLRSGRPSDARDALKEAVGKRIAEDPAVSRLAAVAARMHERFVRLAAR